jgi:EAL domain-containing protein (putative c-di-GMP-specific phosphodiesterase class I)
MNDVDDVMLQALKGLFAGANTPAEDDDERDAAGKPKVTLARALKRGWLEVWYQPKVNLHTGHMIGAEGLIRARHPELGVLGPGAFLPGAGEPEMLEMTEKVIVTALRDWNDCAELGMPAINLAVNVPASAFVALPIAQIIREERPKSDQWPGLILEVTEDQIVNDLKMANEVANELREQRCSLAIDDFGAGYSSLGRLRQLPFSELKIDRAYVMNCNADKVSAGLCEVFVELAKRFGLKTVAEGIETTHESHKLQALGADVGQGYLFAKPMPRANLIGLMCKRLVGRPEPAPARAGGLFSRV